VNATRFVRLAALVCLAATACGSSSSDTSVRTYRSRTYDYAIDHPGDWSVVRAIRVLDDGEPPATGPGGTDILARHASKIVHDMTLPAMVVGAQRVALGTTIDGWTSMVINTVSFMKQCPEPDSTERITVAGEPAMLLRYDDCPARSGSSMSGSPLSTKAWRFTSFGSTSMGARLQTESRSTRCCRLSRS
jgi:hypothetical protein